MATAYCVKCRRKVNVSGGKEVMMNRKRGIWALKGSCPKCGTKVFRITGKK